MHRASFGPFFVVVAFPGPCLFSSALFQPSAVNEGHIVVVVDIVRRCGGSVWRCWYCCRDLNPHESQFKARPGDTAALDADPIFLVVQFRIRPSSINRTRNNLVIPIQTAVDPWRFCNLASWFPQASPPFNSTAGNSCGKFNVLHLHTTKRHGDNKLFLLFGNISIVSGHKC